jgi:hypothetical protein
MCFLIKILSTHLMLALLTAPFEGGIQCNSIHPSSDCAVVPEFWDRAPNLNSYLLKEVFLIFLVETISPHYFKEYGFVVFQPVMKDVCLFLFSHKANCQ